MYKARYANGDTWYEYIKMAPKEFNEYRVDGDGSHTVILTTDTLKSARSYTRMDNHLYASEGGKNKVAHMTDGKDYLTKEDFEKYSKQPEISWGKL